ncbi:AAA family ATPase [Lentisphaerota bacterium WC36G]|nr:AAA family ATPase [Lentisphaerae bacterium WC36]
MFDDRKNALELLKHINGAVLDYQEWLNVGMILKDIGCSCSDWENWSRIDSQRFIEGECYKKWQTFNGGFSGNVSMGTLVDIAKRQGWTPPKAMQEYTVTDINPNDEWDFNINATDSLKQDYKIVDKEWVQGEDLPKPWINDSRLEIISFIEALFENDEKVCYCTEMYFNEHQKRWLPGNGHSDRTAGELIRSLQAAQDIADVIGTINTEAGAFVRINAMDGKGSKDANVTNYRYALIECDDIEIDKQFAMYKQLELPIATLVHSGNKSLHALVKIEATNIDEYKKRIQYLYKICAKNGLNIDKSNRNPSRYSRLPGVQRNDKRQYLSTVNIGKESWEEWVEWVEELNDDLPDAEGLENYIDNPPELEPELIKGVLRQGHKMLIAGPSKAGKSFDMIQLTIAIAEKLKWHGWQCAQGKVLYVNLELSKNSCILRFLNVYKELGINHDNIHNIDIWHLRGKSMPMDKLAPKLIRRALKKKYAAIIIDPIYKVITGDENSAEQMSKFCNQFDKICTELDTSVIYAHHHSKGSQGHKKSADRASGSGVFARDPDAMVDYIELEITEERRKAIINDLECEAMAKAFDIAMPNWRDACPIDDALVGDKLARWSESVGLGDAMRQVRPAARIKGELMTAWRLEGTLREFASFKPVNCFFSYPVHTLDPNCLLTDAVPAGESNSPSWQNKYKNLSPAEKKKQKEADKKERQKQRFNELETSYNLLNTDGKVTVHEMAEATGKSEKTITRYIKEHPIFYHEKGFVFRQTLVEDKKDRQS